MVKKEKVLASSPQASPPLRVCVHPGSDASRGRSGCPPVGLEGSSDCEGLPWWAWERDFPRSPSLCLFFFSPHIFPLFPSFMDITVWGAGWKASGSWLSSQDSPESGFTFPPTVPFHMTSRGLVQFRCSVVSDSLRPHELQHARPPCPSPTPGVHPNSCPLSWWCHPTISFFVVLFSSCPQSFPASGSLQMSQLFASGGQSIGVSASTSVLPVNTQDYLH